ncbi:twin-arginine translocase subunit TatC [Mucilaginibacter sp. UC70_90]
MSFFDHLEALRWHLVRASVAIVIFTAVVFYYYDWIFDTIIMGPVSQPSGLTGCFAKSALRCTVMVFALTK